MTKVGSLVQELQVVALPSRSSQLSSVGPLTEIGNMVGEASFIMEFWTSSSNPRLSTGDSWVELKFRGKDEYTDSGVVHIGEIMKRVSALKEDLECIIRIAGPVLLPGTATLAWGGVFTPFRNVLVLCWRS